MAAKTQRTVKAASEPTESLLPDSLKKAVVQVGEGRGFIVGAGGERFILTAAHCVPHDRIPTPHLANGNELKFAGVIGPLFSEQPTAAEFSEHGIAAELLFYSLVDDIAAFGAPELWHDPLYDAEYEQLTAKNVINIGKFPAPPPPPNDIFDKAAFDSWVEERRQHDAIWNRLSFCRRTANGNLAQCVIAVGF